MNGRVALARKAAATDRGTRATATSKASADSRRYALRLSRPCSGNVCLAPGISLIHEARSGGLKPTPDVPSPIAERGDQWRRPRMSSGHSTPFAVCSATAASNPRSVTSARGRHLAIGGGIVPARASTPPRSHPSASGSKDNTASTMPCAIPTFVLPRWWTRRLRRRSHSSMPNRSR